MTQCHSCCRDPQIAEAMDDALIAISDGVKMPAEVLRRLPPWRAYLVAQVAVKAGATLESPFTINRIREAAYLAEGTGLAWWESIR